MKDGRLLDRDLYPNVWDWFMAQFVIFSKVGQ